MLTPDELFLPFGGFYVCVNFGENRSRNATVRVLADGQTDRLTDANRFYNLSHAICYSYIAHSMIIKVAACFVRHSVVVDVRCQ